MWWILFATAGSALFESTGVVLNREWNERRCWLENIIDFSILFRLRRRRPCRRKADSSFINEVKYEANRIRALDTIILYPTTEGR